MHSPITDYLTQVLAGSAADTSGALADYIPDLATVDPTRAALCLCTVDGTVYGAGDTDVELTIQSMSKPFVYALALTRLGTKGLDDKVDVEPSGEAFNEISLDRATGDRATP